MPAKPKYLDCRYFVKQTITSSIHTMVRAILEIMKTSSIIFSLYDISLQTGFLSHSNDHMEKLLFVCKVIVMITWKNYYFSAK